MVAPYLYSVVLFFLTVIYKRAYNEDFGQRWLFMSVISELERSGKEYHEFEASLGYIASSLLEKNNNNEKQTNGYLD